MDGTGHCNTCAATPSRSPGTWVVKNEGKWEQSHFSQDDTQGGELLHRNDPLSARCSLLMSYSGLVLTRDFLQRTLIWLR